MIISLEEIILTEADCAIIKFERQCLIINMEPNFVYHFDEE